MSQASHAIDYGRHRPVGATRQNDFVPRTEVSSLKQSNINVTGNVPYPDPYQGRDPATFVSTCFTYLAPAFNSW